MMLGFAEPVIQSCSSADASSTQAATRSVSIRWSGTFFVLRWSHGLVEIPCMWLGCRAGGKEVAKCALNDINVL